MQEFLRYCPICGKENKRESYHSKIYVPGCINYYNYEPEEDIFCPTHKEQKLIKMYVTCEEFSVLRNISNNPMFIEQMNELKQKDIIEYELKMSQFRNQAQQQCINNDNTPRCPHCKSTNIKAISNTERAVSVLGFGILSKKINKSFKCLNCKYTW